MTAYGDDPFCEISGELVVIHDTSLRVSTGCLDPDDNEAPFFLCAGRAFTGLAWHCSRLLLHGEIRVKSLPLRTWGCKAFRVTEKSALNAIKQ